MIAKGFYCDFRFQTILNHLRDCIVQDQKQQCDKSRRDTKEGMPAIETGVVHVVKIKSRLQAVGHLYVVLHPNSPIFLSIQK